MQDFGEEKRERVFMSMIRPVLTLLVLFLFLGCKYQNVNPEPIPQVPVNVSINLALKAPFLDVPGSFFYENGGNKGLVVVNDFDGQIKVFERTCSFEPLNQCSQLHVDSVTLQFKCGSYINGNYTSCCESRFDFSGFVVKAPAQFPLLQYRSTRNGNFLNVFN